MNSYLSRRTTSQASLLETCTDSVPSDPSSYLSRYSTAQVSFPRNSYTLNVVKHEYVPFRALNKPSFVSAKLVPTQRRQTRACTFPGTQQPKFCFRKTCTNSPSSNLSTYPSRHSTNQAPLPRSLSKLNVVRPESSLFQVLKQPSSDSAELLQARNRQV